MYCSKCGAAIPVKANFCIKCGFQVRALDQSDVEVLPIRVAGVSFKNGRKSRQTILRKIRWKDDEFANKVEIGIDEYIFEGKPAFGIFANGQQIGNIPISQCDYYKANQHRVVGIKEINVYGGGQDEDGNAKSYGAEVILLLAKRN